MKRSRMRWPAWLVNALGGAAAVVVLAQAHAQPVSARVVPEGIVLRVERANLSTAGAEADGESFGAVLSASGHVVVFVFGATSLVPNVSARGLRAKPMPQALPPS